MRAYKSTNGGATWVFDNTFSGSQKATDKELMWIDHSATSPFKDTIYACWHNGNPGYVNRRNGPAGAWGTPIQVTGAESTGTAIGCSLGSNANGDAFVFWPTTGNSKIVMSKSTNGGTSWGTPKVIATTKDSYDIGVPSFASRRALIYVSGAAYRTATLNNVYASWVDLTGATGCTAPANEPGTNAASTCKSRVWFARSTDGGTTWGAPVMTNNQASLNDQFNQWLGVDDTTGRLALIYYDTVGDSTRKKTDIWYQTSADNGATWSAATKLTTGQTDETITGADSGNQYGDYNSLSIYAGKIFPSWTDRRSGGKEEIWTVPVVEP
jgi:Neuraminidase (sialidase)